MRIKQAKNVYIGERIALNNGSIYQVVDKYLHNDTNTVKLKLKMFMTNRIPFNRNFHTTHRLEIRSTPVRQVGNFQRAMQNIAYQRSINNSVTNLMSKQLKRIDNNIYERLLQNSPNINTFRRRLNKYYNLLGNIENTKDLTKELMDYYTNLNNIYKKGENLSRMFPNNFEPFSHNQFPSHPPSPRYPTH